MRILRHREINNLLTRDITYVTQMLLIGDVTIFTYITIHQPQVSVKIPWSIMC